MEQENTIQNLDPHDGTSYWALESEMKSMF